MSGWNHNVHYHPLVMAALPQPCRCALDVGCGAGELARALARRADRVVGIDVDGPSLALARASGGGNVDVVEGDAMTYPFEASSFDFIAVVASLHHLPLEAALERFRELLRPGGVLAVVGLARCVSPLDYGWAAAGVVAHRAWRTVRGYEEVAAPVREPRESYEEVRGAAGRLLAGCRFRRHLLFRYSILWKKP